MGNFWSYLSVSVLMIVGVLLIFIILLQRGRGGGLAGAFGGAGGQSALGTKAGDVFTKITVALAVIWVLLACFSIYALRAGSEGRLSGLPSAAAGESPEPGKAPAVTDDKTPAAGSKATGGSPAGAGAGGSSAGAAGTEAAGDADGPLLGPAGSGGDAAGGTAAPAGDQPVTDDTP